MIKKIFKVSSYILVIISFIFIYKSLTSFDKRQLYIFLSYKGLAILFFFSFLYSLNSFSFALAWRNLLRIFSAKNIPVKIVFGLYFKSNIAKYLPGNVFHFAGRHLLIEEKMVSHTQLLLANLFEIGLLIISSVSLVLIGVLTGLLEIPEVILSMISFKYLLGGSIIIFIAGALIFILLFKTKRFEFFSNVLSLFNSGTVKKLLFSSCLYSIMYITTGIIFYLVIYYLTGSDFSFILLLRVIFIFTLAWVSGYIVPGAPGGVGIREAILIIMMSPYHDQSVIAMASVILRIITIFGDIFTYLYTYIKILQQGYPEESA